MHGDSATATGGTCGRSQAGMGEGVTIPDRLSECNAVAGEIDLADVPTLGLRAVAGQLRHVEDIPLAVALDQKTVLWYEGTPTNTRA